MNDNQAAQFIKILQTAQRLDPSKQDQLLKVKKVYDMASQLLNDPKYQPLPAALNAELYKFMNGVAARPEMGVAPIRVGSNFWELSLPKKRLF